MSYVVENLCFAYGAQQVLNDVSFRAEGGELLSVLGPNGAGKSTLLRCILGLYRDYKGKIEINGENIHGMPPAKLARLIAYIPQAHYEAFNYSVFNMVLMGTSAQVSAISTPGRAQMERVEDALEHVGISRLAGKSFSHISGGEQQLVLIARALAQNAKVLVLDEPTAGLDYGNQLRVMKQVKALAGEGYTVVATTHNPEQAYIFSTRILALKDGRVIADGPPPEHVTAGLIYELYGVEVDVQSMHGDTIRVFAPKL